MTNPFEFFANDDEDQKYQPVSAEQKPRRTHQQKKMFKQQKQEAQVKPSKPAVTEQLPERHRDDAKQTRNPRHPPTPQTKKLGDGHYHDRQSGTGRVDKPRKEGGGKGNLGNMKDELNQDKYIKESAEESPAQNEEEKAPEVPVVEEPEALTLDQYYKNKGVDINSAYEQKGPAKKADINAEWIKKEKLTVIETKQDKKNSERNNQGFTKVALSRTGLDENLEGLGFGQKVVKKQEEKREEKPDNRGKGRKDNNNKKPVINDDDFPSL